MRMHICHFSVAKPFAMYAIHSKRFGNRKGKNRIQKNRNKSYVRVYKRVNTYPLPVTSHAPEATEATEATEAAAHTVSARPHTVSVCINA
jgi:hypothetical protein